MAYHTHGARNYRGCFEKEDDGKNLEKNLSGLLSNLLKDAMAQVMLLSQVVGMPNLVPALVTHVVEVDSISHSTSLVPPQDPPPLQYLAPPQDTTHPQDAIHAQDLISEDQNAYLQYNQADHVDLPDHVYNSADSNQVQQTNLTDAVCVEGPSHDSQLEDEVNVIFCFYFFHLFYLLVTESPCPCLIQIEGRAP